MRAISRLFPSRVSQPDLPLPCGWRDACASPSSPITRLPSIERPPAEHHVAVLAPRVMPVMLAAICWKLWPSVAPILARK